MPDNKEKESRSRWKIPYFTIWAGQSISQVGSRLATFALVWWLTETTGSATVLATASMAAWVPGIILGPIAGAVVDRWNRRLLMIVADAIIALLAVWIGYLFWTGAMRVWHIYVITLIRAMGSAPFTGQR